MYNSVYILYVGAYQSYTMCSVYMYVNNIQVNGYLNLNPYYDKVLCGVYLF